MGHAGTLDPLATGLLIVCTGRKRKEIDRFTGLDKEYVAELLLGVCVKRSFDRATVGQRAVRRPIRPVSSQIGADVVNLYMVGRHGDALKIKVTAPPLEGRANEEIIEFLAEALGIKKGRLTFHSTPPSTDSISKRLPGISFQTIAI